MRFYDRKSEISKLREIEKQSKSVAQFTVISGRRRIGKTRLLKEAYKDITFLYFFVARKAETELCQTFIESIRTTLNIPIPDGLYTSFTAVFRYIMELSTTKHITLVIDEFQEFYRVNPSVYSDMQNLWDEHKDASHINLIVCGSANTLLNKIFRDLKEPLYGRHTEMIKIGAFSPSVLKQILNDYNPNYEKEDLLALYLFTGGVAKYVELFADKGKLTYRKMLNHIFEPDSFFIQEGKAMLIEEFGKEYGIYFSILSLIAQGYTTRGEIEDMLQCEIGGYLKKLIDDHELIKKHQPLFEQSSNKNVHYELSDQFLRFWFRFIFKYSHIIEAGSNERLKQIVERDYATYSGKALEQYFIESMREKGIYTRLGYWHDRKRENEIDIIAEDELEQETTFFEVKRQAKNIDTSILRAKAETFLRATNKYNGFNIYYRGLSMDDM